MNGQGFQAHIDELAGQVESLRAELAAANARNAELEGHIRTIAAAIGVTAVQAEGSEG